MEQFECKYCGKQFSKKCFCVIHELHYCDSNPLKREIKRTTIRNSSKEGGWTCQCGKNFRTRRELQDHKKICNFCRPLGNSKVRKTYIREICPFCNKEVSSTIEGFKNHCRFCKQNPNRSIKETSEETKKKLSIAAKERHFGGFTKTGGRSKKGYYKGIWCDSSWELAYVIYNLDHNISFKRNTQIFKYLFNGKWHKYLPDFKEGNTYIEIKGYYTDRVFAKIEQFPEKLKLLDSTSIKPYLDYTIQKYGVDFTKLYEDRKDVKLTEEKEKLVKEGRITKKGVPSSRVTSIEEWEYRKKLILESQVDLSKFGYVEKLISITNLTKRQIRNTLLKYNIDHFERAHKS